MFSKGMLWVRNAEIIPWLEIFAHAKPNEQNAVRFNKIRPRKRRAKKLLEYSDNLCRWVQKILWGDKLPIHVRNERN